MKGKNVGLGMVAVALCLVLVAEPTLGTWVTIYEDGFDNCLDWFLNPVITWDCSGSQLRYRAQVGDVNLWRGATYRSASDSEWDPSGYSEARVEYEFLRFANVAPNTRTKQLALVIDQNQDNEPDTFTGTRYFEVRLWQSGATSTYGWNVTNFENGFAETFNYPIENLQNRDVYANITWNIQALRFWINWTTYTINTFTQLSTGAITGTWNDSATGWYSGGSPYRASFWGKSSVSGAQSDMTFRAVNLYVFAAPYYELVALTGGNPFIVEQGSAGTIEIASTGFNGWTGSLDMTLDNPPPGITGSCLPATITPDESCILTVNVDAAVAPGSYQLTVLGTNPDLSNTTSFQLDVTARPPPTEEQPHRGKVHADFAIATTEFGTQFYDASEAPGRIVMWEWAFGDGYGSLRTNPFHAYPCKGTYFVSLLVEDEWGNRGNVSTTLTIESDRPLCGVLQRTEQGLIVDPEGEHLTVPTVALLLIAAFSASTLALGMDFTVKGKAIVSRRARLLLLAISVIGLVVTSGLVGSLIASV